MDNVLNELSLIFKTISGIPVTGDAVDSMAIARAKLRQVYATLEQMERKQESIE